MRGCPFTDATVGKIATSHNVSAAQVCVRWTLQRGAIAALGKPNHRLTARLHKLVACGRGSVRGCVVAGTGADASKVEQYTQEDLDVWDFSLTDDDMAALNALGA